MDAKDFTQLAELIDIYGSLLTDKQREIMTARFHRDLSLSEISEMVEITRSAVQDTIKKTVDKLHGFEKNLQVLKHRKTLQDTLDALEESPLSQAQKTLIQKLKETL